MLSPSCQDDWFRDGVRLAACLAARWPCRAGCALVPLPTGPGMVAVVAQAVVCAVSCPFPGITPCAFKMPTEKATFKGPCSLREQGVGLDDPHGSLPTWDVL